MKYFVYITLLISSINVVSQDFDNLSFGTDSTFEMATWNIEWFPKNEETTANYVAQIIKALDIDVFAIQEVKDSIIFRNMVESIEGYNFFIPPGYFAGLAYIYKLEALEFINCYKIYETEPYWHTFPRSPVVLEVRFNNEEYVIINNHLKCCGDGTLNLNDEDDEENRRYSASNLLKKYIDENLGNKKVIVTGDLNDILTDNESNNVFQPFLNDNENYYFADSVIAAGNKTEWSYPSWPSHLDHILISNELFSDFKATGSEIKTLKIDESFSSWSAYDSNVSDHRPVAIKIAGTKSVVSNSTPAASTQPLIYPNPVNDMIHFGDAKIHEINIYSIQGQLLFSGRELCKYIGNYKPGLYFIKIDNNKSIKFIKK